MARHHFDAKAQHLLCLAQKIVAVACFAQGLGGHGPHLVLVKTLQPFGKAGQTFPAALHRNQAEVLVFVQTAALAHRFFQVLHPLDVAGIVAANFQTKAVGSQVNRSQQSSVFHGVCQCVCEK